MRNIVLTFFTITLVCCGEPQRARMNDRGDPHQQAHVVCYSAGHQILATKSDGPVTNDGDRIWFFRDAGTGQLREASGDCIVTYLGSRKDDRHERG